MTSVTLDSEEEQALRLFVDRLRARLPDALTRVELFGSKARGDSHADSDVDVLVVLRSISASATDSVYDAVMDVLLETGVYLSTVVRAQSDYDALVLRHTQFMQNIAREGIALWPTTGERKLQPAT